jgi:hypothetical protein
MKIDVGGVGRRGMTNPRLQGNDVLERGGLVSLDLSMGSPVKMEGRIGLRLLLYIPLELDVIYAV